MHRKGTLILAISALMTQAVTAQTPTAREQALRTDAALADADRQLNIAFQSAMHELTPVAAAAVRADQRQWLTWIDRICPADSKDPTALPGCLQQQYNDRLQTLTKGRPVLNGTHFFTRAVYVFVPATKPVDPNNPFSAEHRFGYGAFSWPQISSPDADQALWNKAVEAAAVRIEGRREKPLPPDLAKSVDADGSRTGGFHLDAVNDRLITTSISVYTYAWGGAHGGTDQTTFLWWLDRRRAAIPSDVFVPGYQWQSALAAPLLQALQTNPGPDALWSDQKELHEGIAAGLKDLSNWTLSREGLTITFGQYGVGPYSSGMPSATLPWQSLAAHLAPTLHPETLPPLAPPAD